MSNYQKVQEELQHIDKELEVLKARLKRAPEGHLNCIRESAKYTRWSYRRHKSAKKQTIPKADVKFAKNLAVKRVDEIRSKELSDNRKAAELYLKHHHKSDEVTQFLKEHSGFIPLLKETEYDLENDTLHSWAYASYPTNPLNPEKKIFETLKGDHVRSKSELLIANFLFTHQIPYRYECSIELGSNIYYPDFTIRHPQTKELFLWEHFGMMDETGYQRKAWAKLQNYAIHGFLPMINLITSYETLTHPLTQTYILMIIENYFR